MASLSIVVLCGCIVLLPAAQGSANTINCYVCSFTGCKDDFDKGAAGVTTVECNGSCMKGKADDFVTRSCVSYVKRDECESEGDKSACMCTSNLCNGSTNVAVSVAVMGTLALVAGVIMRM